MQSFEGTVISAKVPKTISVAVEYIYRHPKYKKNLRRTTKLLVHNEIDGIKEGDKVKIIKTKPISKNKHFVVAEKI